MAYGETKVYFDGSHYIAIPKTLRPKQGNRKTFNSKQNTAHKAEFERLYRENYGKRNNEKILNITEELKNHFKDENETKQFVRDNIERKKRNAIVRKTRLARKVNLQEWNYFCTFTYDDNKHNEQSFRKKLSNCFKHLSYRKQWKHIGVWERSPEKQRLHFHGIFYVPPNSMIGSLIQHSDYSLINHKRQITMQNTYFNERFGRSDFDAITDTTMLSSATAYLVKYIEKSGEKLVYSKGLPTYFISDIMDEDVICTIGQEDRKLLLFDDFNCFDEGCLMGKVNYEVINKLRKKY